MELLDDDPALPFLGSHTVRGGFRSARRCAAARDGRTRLGATGGGTVVSQTYGYDAFGNLQSISGSGGHTTPTSSATNRLNSPGSSYDTAGNLISWNGATYEFDALDRMWHMQNGTENWIYVYTPDDERIWSIKVGGNNDTWSIRDLNQKVLRDYTRFKSDWSVTRDYLYRGSLLLGAIAPKAPRYYHLDHLGTPRLTTSIIPTPLGYHVDYPYGEETADPNQNDADRLTYKDPDGNYKVYSLDPEVAKKQRALDRFLIDTADLFEDEEVLIGLVREHKGSWILITTERLVWVDVSGVHRLYWHQIQGVQPSREDLEAVLRGDKEKTDLKILNLFDLDGNRHDLELTPGSSYLLAWNAILALCDYSRPLDLPEIEEEGKLR